MHLYKYRWVHDAECRMHPFNMNEDEANIMNPELSWVYCPFYLDLLSFLPASFTWQVSGYCPGFQPTQLTSPRATTTGRRSSACPGESGCFPMWGMRFVFEKCEPVDITSSCHLSASQRGLLSELSVLFYTGWRHPGQPTAKSQEPRV